VKIKPTRKRKILVTGANGFLGRECLRFFLKEKHDTTAWCKNEKEKKSLKKAFPKTSVCCGDIRQIKTKEKYDFVIHQAGLCETKIRKFSAEDYRKINTGGMKALLKNVRFDWLIFNSTAKIYSSNLKIAKEKMPLKNKKSPYAESLYQATIAALSQKPTKSIVLICCNIYGPTQKRNSVFPVFLERALTGKPILLLDGPQRRIQPIYIADYLNALKNVVKKPEAGIYNLAGKESVSLSQLAKSIKKETKSKAPIKMLTNKTFRAPVVDSEKFKKTFKWKPRTGVREGVKRIIKEKKKEK